MPHAINQATPSDTQAARSAMVDSQIRPNKVTEPRLIAALRSLPREAFLPPSLQAWAYADDDVKLGAGRVMVSPMVTARLLQAAAVQPGEAVLLVGAGTGFTAALLAELGGVVTALEEDAALLAIARPALAAVAPAVTLVQGGLAEGWPAGRPYDLIVIEGSVEQLPEAITAQLAPQGRLMMVRAGQGRVGSANVGQAVIGRPTQGGISFAPLFDAAVATLPALRRAPAFVF